MKKTVQNFGKTVDFLAKQTILERLKWVGRFKKSEYRNRPLTTSTHRLYSEFSNQRNENNVYDPDFCALSNHTNKNTNRGLIVETLLRY